MKKYTKILLVMRLYHTVHFAKTVDLIRTLVFLAFLSTKVLIDAKNSFYSVFFAIFEKNLSIYNLKFYFTFINEMTF